MIFQQLLNEESGCLSYLIGCAQAGRAVIVDPGRDRVHDYLRIARKKGLTITDVIETHTHADHISGNRDLGAATKAAIHVHRAAGVTFPHVPLVDGDTLRLGQVELKICHAPGHTPDSICVLVTDHARGTEPWFVLTGDTLFVGSVGRPDLGGVSAAEDLWQSLRRVLQPLPDGSIKTIEGNTSAMPGEGFAQGEGDGVFVKIRPRKVCAAFIRVPGEVPDPKPAAGFDDWAAWVRGGRKAKRPAVPAKVPAAWWAKLGEGIQPAKHPHAPHPAHAPEPAHA